jgi:hypothetical protein
MARYVSELVCGNSVIGRNTMQPNRKEMKKKRKRTIEGEGVVYLSRTIDIIGRAANRPREQESDWTGRVGRTGQTDHSENGIHDSDTRIT